MTVIGLILSMQSCKTTPSQAWSFIGTSKSKRRKMAIQLSHLLIARMWSKISWAPTGLLKCSRLPQRTDFQKRLIWFKNFFSRQTCAHLSLTMLQMSSIWPTMRLLSSFMSVNGRRQLKNLKSSAFETSWRRKPSMLPQAKVRCPVNWSPSGLSMEHLTRQELPCWNCQFHSSFST